MSLAAKVLKIAGCTILSLIVSDLVGVAASFILDVLFSLPIRGDSAGAFYALWFVIGIFAGLLSYNFAGSAAYPKLENGDWTGKQDAGATGRLVCWVVVVLLIGMAFLTFLLSGDTDGDYFVPDNWPLTLTFFVAFGGATFLAHNAQVDSVRKQISPH